MSCYLFRCFQINDVLIDQRFRNRERFAFDYEINRFINIMYSFNFFIFSTFV